MTISRPKTFRSLLLAATILAVPFVAAAPTPAAAQMDVGISVQIAPPVLPIYEQPAMPDAGYIWTPGYWGYEQAVGYYWVPGTWIVPPAVDVLWTPPYWGWSNGAYVFYDGYWGSQVGYYGGVNYGYGYGGDGYQGGRWNHGAFAYNRTVNNFGSVHVTNVYSSCVTVNNPSHASYAGGTGGLSGAPTAAQRQVAQEHHVAIPSAQAAHFAMAAKTPALAVSQNHGHPAIAATSHPGVIESTGMAHSEPAAASGHEAVPGHAGAPAATAAQPETARPAEHAVTPPAAHEPTPSAEHATAPPAQHEVAHPVEHAAAPPAANEVVHQPEHAAAPPAEHEGVRPGEHAAAPPAGREAVRPVEHEAARPAPAPSVVAHAAPPPPHPEPAAHPAPAEKEKEH